MAIPASFADFYNMTPPVYITSPRDIQNDAISKAPMLGRLLLGREPHEILKGGANIQDTIKLSVTGTYGSYQPAESIGGYSLRQSSTLWKQRWSLNRDYMAWTESEISDNIPDGVTGDARHALYKDLKYSKEQDFWTSVFEGMEAQLAAVPHGAANYAAMEGAALTEPLPIYAMINEETDRLPNGWTNVLNVGRAANSNWQNVLNQYDYTDPDDVDGDGDGLLDMFQETHLELQWTPPMPPGAEGAAAYFQKSGQDPSRRWIIGSTAGVKFYVRRCWEAGDRMVRTSDPAMLQPTFGGIPVVQWTAWGSFAGFLDTSSTYTATEVGSTVSEAGYRYIWLDGNFLKVVLHRDDWFKDTETMRLQGQPDTHVVVKSLRWNTFLNSALRQAFVAPGG
jgi:hypothetical protein